MGKIGISSFISYLCKLFIGQFLPLVSSNNFTVMKSP